VKTDQLRKRLAKLEATSPEDASRNSPLKAKRPLPRFFTTRTIEVSDLNSNRGSGAEGAPTDEGIGKVIAELNADGWWPTPLVATSNPHAGPGPAEPAPGDYSTTRVGDRTDTSPYITDAPPVGISVGTFIQNMAALTQHVSV
jgi:hypothetical protein